MNNFPLGMLIILVIMGPIHDPWARGVLLAYGTILMTLGAVEQLIEIKKASKTNA